MNESVFYFFLFFFFVKQIYVSIRIYCNYIESYLRYTIFIYVLSDIILRFS